MVEEDNGAAHALDADVKSDPSTKRGLFENQGDEFAVKSGGVADRTGF